MCGSSSASRSRVKKVSITKEDLERQFVRQDGRCYWLGIPININHVFTTHNPLAPSVDRLNNDRDYEKDNIVICTQFANMGRGKCDEETFKRIMDEIIKYLCWGGE